MQKIFLAIALVVGVMVASYVLGVPVRGQVQEKVYVALEGDGTIVALDAVQRTIVSTVDLSLEKNGTRIKFMPHNVQVAPDNKTVWVAANAMAEEKKQAFAPFINIARADEGHDDGMMTAEYDQVIVIDPSTDTIIKRIPIATGTGLAHIIVSPDGGSAYVTLQKKGALYKIDTKTFAVTELSSFGDASGPHGLRISPDGTKIFVAMVSGKAFTVVSAADGAVVSYPTGSGVVQTAVTPDGRYAFGSLYSSKSILRYEITTQKIDTIALPEGAKGPVQLYTTPDSRALYVADQGYYFDQPTSNVVYRIDIEKNAVDQTIPAGSAPHGVVVDSRGAFVYVTNLLSNDLSVIDVSLGKEVARIPVGTMPNGVSVWSGSLKTPVSALGANTQSAGGSGVLVADEKYYDLGTVSMAKGKVSQAFKIKNTGTAPAVIKKVFTSCMCTTATLSTADGKVGPFGMAGHTAVPEINKTLAAGEEASVEAVFDPAAHGPSGTGKVRRVVYLEVEGSDKPIELSFEANVVK